LLQIIVSFVTLISTMEHQFGVKWPPQFSAALEVFSVLSFDLKFISSLFCIVKIDFWQNMLSTTLTLAAVVILVFFAYFLKSRGTDQEIREYRRSCLFVLVYFLTFSYPLVSVKIVQAFSCHNVNGVDYLTADYSLTCFNAQWQFYAVYSGLFLCIYVVGFPAFIFNILWRYRREDQMETNHGKGGKHGKHGKHGNRSGRENSDRMLGFLRDDYKAKQWACLWEFEEMIRKLSLSVLGAFWSKKSPMCIATALIIAVFFQILHAAIRPYESRACTRLQHLCLSIITILYFCGLLLKVQMVTEQDEVYLGWMLVILLSSVFFLALLAVVSEVYAVVQMYRIGRKAQQVLDDNKLVFDPSLQEHIIAYDDLELLEVLGEGAEGVVRKGTYDGDLVAIKIVHINTVADRGGTEDREEIRAAMEGAQAEAKLMKCLRHPNIVLFYGITLHANSLGLSVLVVMELCRRSLTDQVFDSSVELSWLRKLRYALDVATGMHYLHQKGVVHRDLKPSNVLIDENGKAKVADFGGSVLLLKKEEDDADMMEMTANVGTPVYMAPELMVQARMTNYDGAVDVYSFGIALWVIMVRGRPYEGHSWNMWTMRTQIVKGARPDLDAAGLALAPSAMVRLMIECWKPDPAQRPSSFGKIVQRLKAVQSAIELAERSAPGAPPYGPHGGTADDATDRNDSHGAVDWPGAAPSEGVVGHENVLNPAFRGTGAGAGSGAGSGAGNVPASSKASRMVKSARDSWKKARIRGRNDSHQADDIARQQARASLAAARMSRAATLANSPSKKGTKQGLLQQKQKEEDSFGLEAMYNSSTVLSDGFFSGSHADINAADAGRGGGDHIHLHKVYGEAAGDYDEAEAGDAFAVGEMTANPMMRNISARNMSPLSKDRTLSRTASVNAAV
jgi:serine/threonine protein kinase